MTQKTKVTNMEVNSENSYLLKEEQPLTREERQYIGVRGFEVFYSRPSVQSCGDPYIVLASPEVSDYVPTISYKTAKGKKDIWGKIPRRHNAEALADIIVGTVAKNRQLDGYYSGPIKVFVLDNSWGNVARELIQKYGSKNN